MFEVLLYLFENYMGNDVSLNADHDIVIQQLAATGFHLVEIMYALDWLDGLNRVQASVKASPLHTPHALRYYMPDECEQLSLEGRNFLHYLERVNILDPMTREIVIDRLMALDYREIDLGKIKWVVLIALFNQPDRKAALTLLQDMVLSEAASAIH